MAVISPSCSKEAEQKNLQRKLAWANLEGETTKNKKGEEFANPKKLYELYPLNIGEKDFEGYFLGRKFKDNDSSKINFIDFLSGDYKHSSYLMFAEKTESGKYRLYTTMDGSMWWHSDGEDGPCWPAGIEVHMSEFELNKYEKEFLDEMINKKSKEYSENFGGLEQAVA